MLTSKVKHKTQDFFKFSWIFRSGPETSVRDIKISNLYMRAVFKEMLARAIIQKLFNLVQCISELIFRSERNLSILTVFHNDTHSQMRWIFPKRYITWNKHLPVVTRCPYSYRYSQVTQDRHSNLMQQKPCSAALRQCNKVEYPEFIGSVLYNQMFPVAEDVSCCWVSFPFS